VLDHIPVLIITGPVGVGKTVVAAAISDLLGDAGVPHAMVDADQLRWCYPALPDDRFRVALGLRNLAAVWANYHAAGAQRLVLADVVEQRSDVAGYQQAIPGAAIVVVRLRASLATIERHLRGRETGASLDWHLHRAAELTASMERHQVGDLLIETDGKPVDVIAREALARVGWDDELADDGR
jgi:hypothetical protein